MCDFDMFFLALKRLSSLFAKLYVLQYMPQIYNNQINSCKLWIA